jgi:uncharacterized membrane protein (UPF0127 family)
LLAYLALLVLVALAVAWGGCSSNEADAPDDGRIALRVRASDGRAADLRVEIADSDQERQAGLSGRDSLGRNEGMLFVTEQRLGFWMKDTLLPLSAAFINECGEILHIVDMQPQTLVIHNTSAPYAFGLEVNGGWFAANGIGVGDRVELPETLRPASCD